MKVMEEKVDKMMEQLAERVREVARRDGFHLSPNLSNLERTACTFVAHSEGLRKKKEKRKKRRRRSGTGMGFWSAAPHDASSTLLDVAWWYSTALRIWQSFVRCSPVEYRIMDFSGRILPDMPYSVLLDSTVDTCLRQSTSSWFLLVAMHLALCSLALCR